MIYVNTQEADKAEIIATCRRQVMAAMETGNEGKARTVITELREYDIDAANAIRADVARSYGTDI